MNLNEEVELLKGVPIFSKVEPAKLKLLAFTSERMNFAAGQELFHQGDQGDAMYVILGGVADVLIDSQGGQIAIAELQKNGFVGEIAILCDVPRTATSRRANRSAPSRSPRTCSIAWSRSSRRWRSRSCARWRTASRTPTRSCARRPRQHEPSR